MRIPAESVEFSPGAYKNILRAILSIIAVTRQAQRHAQHRVVVLDDPFVNDVFPVFFQYPYSPLLRHIFV